jgi:hypothetical protein
MGMPTLGTDAANGSQTPTSERVSGASDLFRVAAAIWVDPEADSRPMQTFDRYWWDVACTYVEHAQNCLGAWQVQERRRPFKIVHYAIWRKEEDVPYHRGRGGKLK